MSKGSGSQIDPLYLSFQAALAGQYSIERELGRGGMGVVYLAKEVHLDRQVAIKLLPPERAEDPALRAHFVREARLAAKLSHPNIIPIHAVAEQGGFVFYVMSFVDGETLGQRVQKRGPLSSAELARVLREVAWALSHAHSHGLVHRDVKPDNILLENGSGRVLVADFGIASAAHEATNAGPGGSPEFMSPEQALGKDIDARSDIYSLGVTAYYALSGRLPFDSANPVELLAKQVTETAAPLSSIGIPVSRRTAQLVERCMAKDPAHRPQSADAVAEQLGATLEQRREVPPALRVFVKRTSRLNINGVPPLLVLYGAQAFIAAKFGLDAAIMTFVGGTAAVSFGYLTYAARQMLKIGYSYGDIDPAFATFLEQSREESAVDYRGGRTRLERFLLGATRISGVLLVLSVPTVIYLGVNYEQYPRFPLYFAGLVSAVSLAFFPLGIGYLSLLQRRVDVDTEFWAKVWRGRIGKAAFWLGRKLLGHTEPVTSGTHRATELALGMAAESLFAGLPASTRRELGDLPALVRRLEADAQRLRSVYDEVQDALSSARHADYTDAQADLIQHRDRVHTKLGEAVGALEMIRLNLLRLHAGSGSVESLTTNLDMAEDVTIEVERLLAARKDVERMLQYPRETALTPT